MTLKPIDEEHGIGSMACRLCTKFERLCFGVKLINSKIMIPEPRKIFLTELHNHVSKKCKKTGSHAQNATSKTLRDGLKRTECLIQFQPMVDFLTFP